MINLGLGLIAGGVVALEILAERLHIKRATFANRRLQRQLRAA